MDVDPVIPPVHIFRPKVKERPLLGHQCRRKQARVLTFEDMLIVKYERLVKFDEFFDADEVALGLGKRGLLHAQGRGRSIESGYYRLLHGNREPFIALFRHRNGLEFNLQPVVDALCAPVMLAVRKSGQFDTAAHIHGIDR